MSAVIALHSSVSAADHKRLGAETKDAPRSVPRAMFMTVLINGVLALCFSIALMYTLGDITVTLDASSGWLPITGVLLSATGSRAATTALIALMTAIFIFGSFNIFASVSRLTWSFARDGGLPFSNFFSRVSLKRQVSLKCKLADKVAVGASRAQDPRKCPLLGRLSLLSSPPRQHRLDGRILRHPLTRHLWALHLLHDPPYVLAASKVSR